jgi:CheY-like chemotaxis protein
MAALALADVGEVVDWLEHVEERVGHLYEKAAALCRDDAPLHGFLAALAEDERSHAGWMSEVAAHLREARIPPSLDIVLDETMSSHVEAILDRFDRFLSKPEISSRGVLEYVARAETSEMNPVFLYVIDELRETGREGQRITGEIQKHLLRIQGFIDGLPREERPSMNITILPQAGEIRMLVVDDDPPLQGLLRALLARRGTVDTAASGEEALTRMRENFHEVVVSDMQIPDMDGLELYRRAVQYDSHLKTNFVFYSAQLAPKDGDYLKQNKLTFLRKPFGLTDCYKAVDRILWGDGPGISSDD